MEEKPTMEKESTVEADEAPVETKEASAGAEETSATEETSTAKEASSTEAWTTEGCAELLSGLGRDCCALWNSLGGFRDHAHCCNRLCSYLCVTTTRALRENARSYEAEAHRQAKNEGNDKFSQFQHRVSSTFCSTSTIFKSS